MVFIKTISGDIALYLDVDTRRTTLLALKEEIGKKWIIQPMLQKLYLGLDYNLDYNEIMNNPSMQLRDDLYECCNKLSLSQLGVEPWSTILLVGPVLRPRSFFESPDAVVIAAGAFSDQQLNMKAMMEQEHSLLMNNKKLKMA